MFIPFISSFKITLSSKLPVYYFSQVIMPSSCTPSCSPSLLIIIIIIVIIVAVVVIVIIIIIVSFVLGLIQSSSGVSSWNLRQLQEIFFTCFCCCYFYCVVFFRFLGFYFALICFVVAYIDNAFLSMCAVLASTIFCISARFCLAGIFSRCFSVPFFTNRNAPTTIWIIVVFNCHILSTSI